MDVAEPPTAADARRHRGGISEMTARIDVSIAGPVSHVSIASAASRLGCYAAQRFDQRRRRLAVSPTRNPLIPRRRAYIAPSSRHGARIPAGGGDVVDRARDLAERRREP